MTYHVLQLLVVNWSGEDVRLQGFAREPWIGNEEQHTPGHREDMPAHEPLHAWHDLRGRYMTKSRRHLASQASYKKKQSTRQTLMPTFA